MHTHVRTPSLNAYQVILYNQALHPELFALKGRRRHERGGYELETWLMHGMHVLRFAWKNRHICELLTDQSKSPVSGVVSAFLAAGERDYEKRFDRDGITYMTSVQTETLSENLFESTYEEISALEQESKAVAVRWNDDAGRCLSLVDVQEMTDQVHAQCYHLLANGGIVIRTQTLFEVR